MKFKPIITIVALVLCIAPCVQADVYFDDITNWTGTGDNQAAMIIHWSAPEVYNNTSMSAPITDLSLVWGYNFNGTATGGDMMEAIAAADTRLYVIASGDPAMGAAILGIGYDLDNDGVFGLSDGSTTYTQADFSDGFLDGFAYADGDSFLPTDSGDLYWGGWYGPNWELWHEQGGHGGFEAAPDCGEGEYWSGSFFDGAHGEWDFSGVGISSITLEDGSWVGWSVAAGGLDMADFEDEGTLAWMNYKQAPIEPDISPVPLPAAVWLLGSGLLWIAGLRRRYCFEEKSAPNKR